MTVLDLPGRPRRPLPDDPALPALKGLAAEPLAGLLSAAAPAGTVVTDARVRLLDWEPGLRLVALVDGRLQAPDDAGTRRAEAVVRALAGAPVGVRWVPDDPELPLLALPWARAAARLAYVPGRRVVVRHADRVLKGYASAADFERAALGLDVLHHALGGQTARPDRPMGHVLTTVQRAVDGEHPGLEDAVGTGLAAGEVLARLHASQVVPTQVSTPAVLLAGADRAVRVLEAALPVAGRRARRLHDLLAGSTPSDPDLVLSHGDFTREQLVTTDRGTVLLDADTVTLGPRGLDVASYPANLVSGRPGDVQRADEALDAVLDGYGTALRNLDWHLAVALLRRCDRPFRRLKSRWDERTTLMLDATEEVTRRCAAVRV